MAAICLPAGDNYVSVKIDENDPYAGVLKLLKSIRPNWTQENIKLKILTNGITNKLVSCQYLDSGGENDIMLVRIYGNKTDLFIDRTAEIRNIKTLNVLGLAPQIYGIFENGLAYQYYPGNTLDIETVTNDSIWPLVATQMAKMHRVQLGKDWCLDLGIREVTVYAFSIENFKRSKEEVDGLMDLARDKFQRLMEEIDQINEWGVRMHVAGRLSLLPEDLRRKVSKSMLATRHNNKLRLNIAYAYTGRDEISRAASHIVDGVKNSEIMAQDIDDELVSKTLELGEPDLLVRTSGEVRLSDFMIWQVSNTVLYFTEALWPEFTIWNLLAAIIHFQRHASPPKEAIRVSDTKQQFLDKLESQRWKQIEKLVSCS